MVLGGSKSGLFGTLNCDYSPLAAAAAMGRLAKLAARHMGDRGFSIGIDDVRPLRLTFCRTALYLPTVLIQVLYALTACGFSMGIDDVGPSAACSCFLPCCVGCLPLWLVRPRSVLGLLLCLRPCFRAFVHVLRDV